MADDWKESRREEAGRRFHALHQLRREEGSSRPRWLRAVYFIVGGALVGLALVFTFIPGPNWLFFVPGASLLATESGLAAALMDLIERALTPLTSRFRRVWGRLGKLGKSLIMLFFLGLAAAFAYWMFS